MLTPRSRAMLHSAQMLSIEDLRFFAVVSRSPTLAAAARSLDVSAPAVSQRLQQIEAKARARLLDRSSRRLTLTGEGRLLAERAQTVLALMDQIADDLATRHSTVAGHLCVVAPFGFGRRFVGPVAAQFRREHPAATVELILSDNPLRLGAESWDLVVHIGALKDSRLVAQRLAPNRRIACAAPDYIRRRGAPSTPAELRRHDCIALRENDEDVTLWRFAKAGSDPVTVRIDSVMSTNNGEIAHDWALAGIGVIVRSEWDVAEDLRSGRLVQVLEEWELPSADVTALVSDRSGKTARSKRFVQLLRSSLMQPPWRTNG
jgi:DNA-binding transcriptional LysR family regulator